MTQEDFIRESNRIEGILRAPTHAEIEEHNRFLAQDEITIEDLERFVSVYQPHAKLRSESGMNVTIADHMPPPGGVKIPYSLQKILDLANNRNPKDAYQVHVQYELLHPFTDGNGRSGRILWLWCMSGNARLGFLHTWYYQSLSHARKV